MTEDLHDDSVAEEEETLGAENLALEETEFENQESAYLVNDEEISEEFQFQS